MAFRVNYTPNSGTAGALAHTAGLGAYQKDLERFQFAQAQQGRQDFQYDTTLGENQRQFNTGTEQRRQEFNANYGLQQQQLAQQEAQDQRRVQAAFAQLAAQQQQRAQEMMFQQAANERNAVLGANLNAGQRQQQAFLDQGMWREQNAIQQQGRNEQLELQAQLEQQGFEDRFPFQMALQNPHQKTLLEQQNLLQSGQMQWNPAQQDKFNKLQQQRQSLEDSWSGGQGMIDQGEYLRQSQMLDQRQASLGMPQQRSFTPQEKFQQDSVTLPDGRLVLPNGRGGYSVSMPPKAESPNTDQWFQTPEGMQKSFEADLKRQSTAHDIAAKELVRQQKAMQDYRDAVMNEEPGTKGVLREPPLEDYSRIYQRVIQTLPQFGPQPVGPPSMPPQQPAPQQRDPLVTPPPASAIPPMNGAGGPGAGMPPGTGQPQQAPQPLPANKAEAVNGAPYPFRAPDGNVYVGYWDAARGKLVVQ